MELEDDAFAATEERIASSGWSTETELDELRAKRRDVRRKWEGRIEQACKKRRNSDGRRGSDGLSIHTTSNTDPSATPVITLQATPLLQSTPTLTSVPPITQL
jgi:hypothetical protein